MATDDGAAQKAQMRVVFDRISAEYDQAGPGCFAWYGQRLVDEAHIEPGAHVLDVASGRGAVLFPAAERVGPTGRVVGIDLSSEMVRAITTQAQQHGIQVETHVMDAEHLDFPDETFDHVLCGFGVMFFPNLDRALSEFRRVLKPGGRVAASTWQISQAHDLAVVLDDLGLGGPGESGWIADPDELASVLERAGFQGVHVIADAHGFRYRDIEDYWQTARGTGLRRRLDTLDPEQTERVRTVFAERVRLRRRPEGLYLEAVALLGTASR